MNEQEKSQKLIDILNNEAIMTQIANANTKEDMQAVFANNGLDMTMAEVDAFIQLMNSNNEDEISESDLESVSGGAGATVTAIWIFSQAITGIKKVAKTCWNAGKWFANNVG